MIYYENGDSSFYHGFNSQFPLDGYLICFARKINGNIANHLSIYQLTGYESEADDSNYWIKHRPIVSRYPSSKRFSKKDARIVGKDSYYSLDRQFLLKKIFELYA